MSLFLAEKKRTAFSRKMLFAHFSSDLPLPYIVRYDAVNRDKQKLIAKNKLYVMGVALVVRRISCIIKINLVSF